VDRSWTEPGGRAWQAGPVRNEAVVIGAGMAGLAAARVLADRFAR
jgi:cation diffusion facilitator CzcD-associated flavoprotein CzcO